jgi:hypothetical protein
MPVDLAKLQQADAMANNLSYLKEMVPVGCSEAGIAAASTWLRDVADSFSDLWKVIALPGEPALEAYSWIEAEYYPGATYICFGGAEVVPEPAALIAARLLAAGVAVPEGMTVLDGAVGQTWLDFNDPRDNTMGGHDPFVRRVVTIAEFFRGVVVVLGSKRINRFDIIQYACYGRGHTHSIGDRYRARDAEKAGLLDEFDRWKLNEWRSNVSYILLSIARDIVSAPDIARFIQAVRAV